MLLMDSWSEEMPAELGAGGDLEVRASELPAQSTSQEPLSHGRSGPEQAEPPSSQTHPKSGREKMNEWRRLLPGLWTVGLSQVLFPGAVADMHVQDLHVQGGGDGQREN